MDKNNVRDALTGKRISPNKEVIEITNAIDYVKKMGFIIVRPLFDKRKLEKAGLYFLIMIFLFALIPLVSSAKYTAINSYANWTFDNSTYLGWDTGTDHEAIGNITFTGGSQVPVTSPCIDHDCVDLVGTAGAVNNPEINAFTGTLAVWINPQGNSQKILWQSVGSGTANSGIFIQRETNGSITGFADGGGTEDTFGFAYNLTATWTQIVIKINSTGIFAYRNGTKLGTPVIATGKGWFRTGAGSPIFLQSANAGYDEVKFFNVEMTDSNISDLYKAEAEPVIPSIYPVFYNESDNPASPTIQQISPSGYNFTIRINDTNGSAYLNFDGTNYTMSNVSNKYSAFLTGLSPNTYNYYFQAYGNGSSHLLNRTSTETYTISGFTYPLFTNENVTHSGNNYTFMINVFPQNNSVGIFFNNVNYTLGNSSNPIFNITINNISAGSYNYYYWAYNGTFFNTSSVMSINVQKQVGNVGIFVADFTTTNGILIFIIEIIVAILCYAFVSKPLGSFFIMIVGFVALVNQNLLIGLILIIGSVSLVLLPDKK